ncbi:Transcriptional regulatory protein moc3-like protein 5 [Stagonosporopsis vannaccii]|nr:Transcriptional regulatory protein moc3-like protein 5 [Stagonosporopsis vannaccii]
MPNKKRARTRDGCLNCKRKRRKCDEQRPTCKKCSQTGLTCKWGARLSFQLKNAYTLARNHPSMQLSEQESRPRFYQILDVTSEVIRDYWHQSRADEIRFAAQAEHSIEVQWPDIERGARSPSGDTPVPNTPVFDRRASTSIVPSTAAHSQQYESGNNLLLAGSAGLDNDGSAISTGTSIEGLDLTMIQRFDTHTNPAVPSWYHEVVPQPSLLLNGTNSATLMENRGSLLSQPPDTYNSSSDPTENLTFPGDDQDSPFTDGIFLPGSAYHELHTTLRDHIFSTARSTGVTGHNSPVRPSFSVPERNQNVEPENSLVDALDRAASGFNDQSNHQPLQFSKREEYMLWKNYTDELAPWLDKFDLNHHFQYTLPYLAETVSHLRYSILALSARQLERKSLAESSSRSLNLYQEAIHHLLPELNTVNTAVIASCVVLCVLEMMSCAPKEWRRHLDGCASLIKSVGINGFSGGVEQALFWCFARMDVCGGFISSERTIIPISTWTSESSRDSAIGLFQSSPSFDTYACYAVYICGQVLDFLADSQSPAETLSPTFQGTPGVEPYRDRWKALFLRVIEWYEKRPSELKPIFQLSAEEGGRCPFPTLLFSNAPAISGNQLFHTAAILMLQHRPKLSKIERELSPESVGRKSILWHARRVCAISISNTHHGCWSNAVQPLWIAGKLMSHPAEHTAILDLYKRIEVETGWGTQWRADDLRDFWGDLDD